MCLEFRKVSKIICLLVLVSLGDGFAQGIRYSPGLLNALVRAWLRVATLVFDFHERDASPDARGFTVRCPVSRCGRRAGDRKRVCGPYRRRASYSPRIICPYTSRQVLFLPADRLN